MPSPAHRRLIRDRSGVTIVEFAILLPFFLTLLFGIIEFGQAMFLQAALQHAVSVASRCATVFATPNSMGSATPPDCSPSNVPIYASSQAYGISIPTKYFTLTTPAGSNCVAAAYPFNFSIPFMANVFALTLNAKSCYPS